MNTEFYDRDAYMCIINGERTYRRAAADLRRHGSVVLNWVHERGTMYNILLTLNPVRAGAPGGLVDSAGDKMWVGIAGRGCFGFAVTAQFVSPEYVSEKLGLTSPVDAEYVAELVTGIRTTLAGEPA